MASDTPTLRRAMHARTAVIAAPTRRRGGMRCATGAFVARLLERGAVVLATVRPLQMALRAAAGGSETTLTHLTAGVDLRFTFTTVLSPVIRSRSRREPMSAWLPAPAIVAAGEATEPQETSLLERIMSRERRIEVYHPAPPASAAFSAAVAMVPANMRSPAPPSATHSELVVRRSVVVLPPAEREAPTESSPFSPRGERLHHRRTADVKGPARPTIPLSPSELTRLTDDVVRVLDSRVVAHRERRGAI